MGKKRILNIISDNFPFGSGEQFFEAEIHEMAGHFDAVVLYPLRQVGPQRELPENVSVNLVLANESRKFSKGQILKHFFLILRIVGYEFLKSDKRGYILKKMKRWIFSIVQCRNLATAFEQTIDRSNQNYFYSFWMNDGALLLAMLKSKGRIENFAFRVNGFDIFNERHEGNYMPFRYFNYKHVNKIFVLSKGAFDYLKGLNIHPEKLILAHYGIFEKGLNTLNENTETIRVVSCANVIPLKRIDKIIGGLELLTEFKVEWTHFGDGHLMDEIQKKAAELPENISVDFRGNRPNTEILETYHSESVNLFVHTSETEGLGMAIIEAQSFGIPAVVIGVGGVLDIVSEKTGVVLKPEAGGIEVAEAMRGVLSGDLNTQAYRTKIQKHCLEIFNAKRNYKSQFDALTEDNSERNKG